MNREEMLGPVVSPETGKAYEPGSGYKGVGIGAAIVAAVAIRAVFGLLSGHGPADVPRQIAAAVSEAQSQLPIRVDDITTITSVSAQGTRIIYGMRIDADIPTSEIATARTEQQADLNRQACTTPESRRMIEAGATLAYRYTDRSGDTFATEIGSCAGR